MDQPGWTRAGYTGAGCEKYEHNRGDRPIARSEREPGGWERAGYTTPSCERFIGSTKPSLLAPPESAR